MEGVRMLPVYGGQDITRQIAGLKGAQVVVGTPGRVMDHMRRRTIRMDQVQTVVLDEADEMLDMGFREDMEVILGGIDHPHQTCLFSATMPKAIMEMANQFQTDPLLIRITRKELTTNNIHQYYYPVKWEYKNLALLRLLDYYQYRRSVIFCNTKSMVDALAELLQKSGYKAEGLHGDLTQKQRDSVMGRFRAGRSSILIATDIAARGIDVDDVEAVFNYDVPQETEHYVHRIGRTGRAGREGAAHTLCRARDFQKIHAIEAVCHASMEERRIPSVESIRKVREEAALDRVMGTLSEGKSGALIPLIRAYCDENEITAEVFAAAALRMLLGDTRREGDDIDVDIPKKSGRGRRDFKGGRTDRPDGSRRDYRERRKDRSDGSRRDYREHGKDRVAGDSRGFRETRRDGVRRTHADEEQRFGFRKKGEDKGKSVFGREKRRRDRQETGDIREVKKKNKERSRSILERAVKDIRMSGEPNTKKKHR
jgi:ATP-dependent RNA helicase DeaD